MPKPKLTIQEQALIEMVSKGIDELDAIKRAYNCSTDQSAWSIKNKVFKRPRVQEELRKIEELRRERLADKGKKIVDYIGELITDKEVAEIIVRNAKSEDRRMSDVGVEKILKLKNSYPPTSYGIFRDLERERDQVLTEGDIKKQLMEGERIGIIQEEDSGKDKEVSKKAKDSSKEVVSIDKS